MRLGERLTNSATTRSTSAIPTVRASSVRRTSTSATGWWSVECSRCLAISGFRDRAGRLGASLDTGL